MIEALVSTPTALPKYAYCSSSLDAAAGGALSGAAFGSAASCVVCEVACWVVVGS